MRIVYLGGLYSAELSLRQSLVDNGCTVQFFVNDFYVTHYGSTPVFKAVALEQYGLVYVSNSHFKEELKKAKPDLVIHRYYRSDPLMYRRSGDVCRELGVPFIVYRQETWPLESIQVPECDLFLYGHKCDEEYLRKTTVPCAYYPYGVSSLERYCPDVEKTYDLAMFGFGRTSLQERVKDFMKYVRVAISLKKRIDVFWDDHDRKKILEYIPHWQEVNLVSIGDMVDYRGHPITMPVPSTKYEAGYLETIRFNEQFPLNQQTEYMSRTNVVVSVDAIPCISNAFSYKLWQSLGCGIPTITYDKGGREELFGNNGEHAFFVKTEDEIREVIEELDSSSLRKEVGQRAYKYMHERYDWYRNLRAVTDKKIPWKSK